MKKSLLFSAAIAITLGTVSALATDKKPADPVAAPATDKAAPGAAPTAAPTTAPAADKAAPKKQTLCPKCSRKIQKKFYTDCEGKRIYCCSSFCASKIKKDAASIVTKLEAEGIVLDAVEKKTDKKK
jgi:hypothetical protein